MTRAEAKQTQSVSAGRRTKPKHSEKKAASLKWPNSQSLGGDFHRGSRSLTGSLLSMRLERVAKAGDGHYHDKHGPRHRSR